MVDAVGQLALSVLTTLERVFALWKGLLDGNILSWQCNYLEMMYVYIQPLWFFANKACLKQGITCMHYLQLAKLWLAGITQSQQRTSLHRLLLSVPVLFCRSPFFFVLLAHVPHSIVLQWSLLSLSIPPPFFMHLINWASLKIASECRPR